MDARRTGELIRSLRCEAHMTQKQFADALAISDKTVSKWERGQGCPDVSLLPNIADAFGCDVESLLAGKLAANDIDGGHMKRLKFYVCPQCGNVMTATGNAAISCCGRPLEALAAHKADEDHAITIEDVEDESYLTFDHPMEKGHYLKFVAAVSYDRFTLVRLYPEQGGETRMPALRRAKLFSYCTEHGLMEH